MFCKVNGVKFWCYNAGHVLGAAMFMLEIAGVKILYTGSIIIFDFECLGKKAQKIMKTNYEKKNSTKLCLLF